MASKPPLQAAPQPVLFEPSTLPAASAVAAPGPAGSPRALVAALGEASAAATSGAAAALLVTEAQVAAFISDSSGGGGGVGAEALGEWDELTRGALRFAVRSHAFTGKQVRSTSGDPAWAGAWRRVCRAALRRAAGPIRRQAGTLPSRNGARPGPPRSLFPRTNPRGSIRRPCRCRARPPCTRARASPPPLKTNRAGAAPAARAAARRGRRRGAAAAGGAGQGAAGCDQMGREPLPREQGRSALL